jgi:predicted nucleotidyltransferase
MAFSAYIWPMTRGTVLSRLRDDEAELRKLGIESLSLFGSVARDEDNEESDVDVAVKLDPTRTPIGIAYFGFLDVIEQRLEEALGVHVDVVDEPAEKASLQREIDRDRCLAF